MNLIRGAIIGNACGPFAGPDFQHATPLEIAAWGVCLSIALVLFGLAFQARRSSEVRRNCSLAVAFIFLVAGCVISLRSQQRGMIVSDEQYREDVEKIRQIQLERQSSKKGEKVPQQPDEQPGPNK